MYVVLTIRSDGDPNVELFANLVDAVQYACKIFPLAERIKEFPPWSILIDCFYVDRFNKVWIFKKNLRGELNGDDLDSTRQPSRASGANAPAGPAE